MQPLCFSYSNGLCATNIQSSWLGWSVIHAGRQHRCRNSRLEANIKISWWTEEPFISLLWNVSRNPTFNKTLRLAEYQPNWLMPYLHHFTTYYPRCSEISSPFLVDKFQVYYATCIPTHSLMVSSRTFQFPMEMMSHLTSPGCSSKATQWLKQTLGHLFGSSWH